MNININNFFDDFDLSITNCDISDISTETNRFMFHILLIHLITFSIDRKDELLGSQLFKTLFITALAVIVYHTIFKKFMNAKLKNIQSSCNNNANNKTITNKTPQQPTK